MTSIVFSFSLIVATALNAQQSCVDLGDPAGNFVPRGFCLPVDPGDIGEAADITLENVTLNVVADPDGRFDLIVPLDPSITSSASAPINYTTSLQWPGTPVLQASVRVVERGINFFPDPTAPHGGAITNVPAGATPPSSFSWIEDPNDATMVIGWTVSQELGDLPPSFGGSISHYHMTTWDLPVGTEVTFNKRLSGGLVVPEPASVSLALFATLSLLLRRRSR